VQAARRETAALARALGIRIHLVGLTGLFQAAV